MADVKNSSFLPLLLTTAALISSCGGDFAPEGTFRGTVVMEDGTTMVTLELKADNKAEVRGLFPKTARGTWEKDTTGLGFGKNGVVATFDSKKDGTAFRVVLMLQPHDEGMTLADIFDVAVLHVEGKEASAKAIIRGKLTFRTRIKYK